MHFSKRGTYQCLASDVKSIPALYLYIQVRGKQIASSLEIMKNTFLIHHSTTCILQNEGPTNV